MDTGPQNKLHQRRSIPQHKKSDMLHLVYLGLPQSFCIQLVDSKTPGRC